MSAAIMAASIGSVPDPHIGSRNAPPRRSDFGPARAQQYSRRQVLTQRRLAAAQAVAAAVQPLARKVDVQQHARAGCVRDHAHGGPVQIDVRAHAADLAQLVADGVLQLAARRIDCA